MTTSRAARFVVAAALTLATARTGASDPVPVSASLPDPEAEGPFPVGVTTCTFYDPARVDPRTSPAPRGLKTEIWYPADDDSRALPRNRFSDFLDRGTNPSLNALATLALGAAPAEIDKRFRDTAARDARCRDGVFPLLLFSHGNGAVRTQSVFWCEHMASHGYVVVAPDHTGNATATTLGGRIVLADGSPGAEADSAKARPADVSFLIDKMGRLARGDDSRFAGRIDMERIGVAGHSFGADTAIRVANSDPRVRAVSPWATAFEPLSRHDVPVLLLLAGEDVALTAAGLDECRRWFTSLTGPGLSVEFVNAGHYSFTEMFQLRPAMGDGVGEGIRVTDGRPIAYVRREVVQRYIDGFTLAFFDRYLKGLVARDAYLGHNPMPTEIRIRPTGPR